MADKRVPFSPKMRRTILARAIAKQFQIFFPKGSTLFRWGTKADKRSAYEQTRRYVVKWPKLPPPKVI